MTGSSAPGPASLRSIARDFLVGYPKPFALLFVVLLFEGVVATTAVLAVVPLADFLLDPSLRSPSRVTLTVVTLLRSVGLEASFSAFGALFVAANVMKGLFDIATKHAILRIKYAVSRGLFSDALGAFFNARWAFFSGTDQGRLLNTLNRELTIISDTLGHLATQLAQAVQLGIYLIVPMWLNAPMTLTAIGLLLLAGAPLLLLNKVSYQLGQRNTDTANSLMRLLNEILTGARLILGFGRQRQSHERFLAAFDDHIGVTLRSQTLSVAVTSFYKPMGVMAAMVALGLAVRNGDPVGEMAALLWSLVSALPLLSGLMSTSISISNFLPSYEQLTLLRHQAAELKEIQGDKIFVKLCDQVELRHVDFTYPGRDQTLRGISLSIRKGQTVAVVGESGSGKSTITDLILGLQIPDKGDVLLDGVPLSEWNQNSFRERVGYVPQDPLLFHASIRENLLWSQPTASESDLWEACRMANAEAFVRDLPKGFDTIVGDRGARLSGGQRQRIALARALLRNPELLILDEATSALDSESEGLIQEAIGALSEGTTILVIAHRLSTILRADQVYVLRHGRIVEEGSYHDLSRRPGGVLAAMLAAQAGTPIPAIHPS